MAVEVLENDLDDGTFQTGPSQILSRVKPFYFEKIAILLITILFSTKVRHFSPESDILVKTPSNSKKRSHLLNYRQQHQRNTLRLIGRLGKPDHRQDRIRCRWSQNKLNDRKRIHCKFEKRLGRFFQYLRNPKRYNLNRCSNSFQELGHSKSSNWNYSTMFSGKLLGQLCSYRW